MRLFILAFTWIMICGFTLSMSPVCKYERYGQHDRKLSEVDNPRDWNTPKKNKTIVGLCLKINF